MNRRDFLGAAQAVLMIPTPQKLLRTLVSHPRNTTQRPNMRLGDMLGVNVHFIEPVEAQLDAMAKAGFRWVRTDLIWAHVERVTGTYDFRGYDLQFDALARYGLSPYAILDYGNPLYDQGLAPAPGRDSYAAFLKFAEAALSRYGRLVEVWEVWNEPNNMPMWKPRPDVQAYASLCRDVGAITRRVAPSARAIGGAIGGIDMTFLEHCAKLGAFEHVDAVSVHPYRTTAPETAIPEMDRAETTLKAVTGRDVPVIAGEWGYTTAKNRISPMLQAAYLVRMMLSNFGTGRAITIWYDLVRDGNDPSAEEHNFGILQHGTLSPLPAYSAALTLSRLLGEATLISADVDADGTWLLRLDKRGLPAAATWASAGSVARTVDLGQQAVAFDMLGNLMWRTAAATSQLLRLDPELGPIYILGSDVRLRS